MKTQKNTAPDVSVLPGKTAIIQTAVSGGSVPSAGALLAGVTSALERPTNRNGSDAGLSEGYSIRQLAKQSGHSPWKLRRIIKYYLVQTPPETAVAMEKCQHMIIDGTYIHRTQGLVALLDADTHRLVGGKYAVSESSWPQLKSFLSPLIKRGLRPHSFTIDGNPHLMKVLRLLWTGIVIQRCLIHIQRQGLSWCRTQPKTPYARQGSFFKSPVSTPGKNGMRFLRSLMIGKPDMVPK